MKFIRTGPATMFRTEIISERFKVTAPQERNMMKTV
jgi:hypothetical protein